MVNPLEGEIEAKTAPVLLLKNPISSIIFKVHFLPGFEITFYKVITIKKFIFFFHAYIKGVILKTSL